MLNIPGNRGGFVRAMSLLSVALVCVMGTLQATHSHPADSATTHHTCTICATVHAGVNTQTAAAAPVLAATPLAILVAEASPIFRPAITQFIRPPPVL